MCSNYVLVALDMSRVCGVLYRERLVSYGTGIFGGSKLRLEEKGKILLP